MVATRAPWRHRVVPVADGNHPRCPVDVAWQDGLPVDPRSPLRPELSTLGLRVLHEGHVLVPCVELVQNEQPALRQLADSVGRLLQSQHVRTTTPEANIDAVLELPPVITDYCCRLGRALRLLDFSGFIRHAFTSLLLLLQTDEHGDPCTVVPCLLYTTGASVRRVPVEAEALLLQCGLHSAYPAFCAAHSFDGSPLSFGFAARVDAPVPYGVPPCCSGHAPDGTVSPASDAWHRAARDTIQLMTLLSRNAKAGAAGGITGADVASWMARLDANRPVSGLRAPSHSEASAPTRSFAAELSSVVAEIHERFAAAKCHDGTVVATVGQLQRCADVCGEFIDKGRRLELAAGQIATPEYREAEFSFETSRHLLGPGLCSVGTSDAQTLIQLTSSMARLNRRVSLHGRTYTFADPLQRVLELENEGAFAWQLAARCLQQNPDVLVHFGGRSLNYRDCALTCLSRASAMDLSPPPAADIVQGVAETMPATSDIIEVLGRRHTRLELATLGCRLAPSSARALSALAIMIHTLSAEQHAAAQHTDAATGETFTAWGCAQQALLMDPGDAAAWEAVSRVMPLDVDASGGLSAAGHAMDRQACAETAELLRASRNGVIPKPRSSGRDVARGFVPLSARPVFG